MIMRVLAFDCCLRHVSVTVLDGTQASTRCEATAQGGQAERLMPLIEAGLADAGLAFAQIERIAVTLGPGGFTSIRVGIAAARALALALGVPAVGLSSLDVLALTAASKTGRDAPMSGRLVAVIAAGKGGVYHCAYDQCGVALTPACVIESPDLATAAQAGDMLIGPGSDLVVAALGPDAAKFTAVHDDIDTLSEQLARRAHLLTAGIELRPIYLRAADAKPQMGKKLARA
jgi:tRNA threonylcarbamoyladenosine biosynthesis protein TsaB